jgi:hypothetical protein
MERRLRFELNLVDKTPHPIFAWLDRLHDGMFCSMKVFRSMFVFGRIATAHVSAFAAQSQVNPGVAGF